MSLTDQLLTTNQANRTKIDNARLSIMDNAVQQLTDSGIEANTPVKGDTLPAFSLPGVDGKTVSLQEVLNGRDFAVVSFYRGGWCPYCNLELRALQQTLPELKELNAALVAITPETPDNSLTTSEKNELAFPVLSDLGNVYARELGLVFSLPADLREVYDGFGIDLKKNNGDDLYELPLPATFVIDADANILLAFAPADYTKRLDPADILQVLREHSVPA
ncbi:peroxiredoxin-like family protein [Neolewinella agarilytica]|uniref:thioredoxin-dependent peroxiredoxin n=1 Tax=Neolewinella agarilytica TaxID=478744 RepID=A0A1H9C1M1_9BACT|nr:peroxiredoxin-like family protein [Neolewinella agarilytica]SEP95146.1 Peroxiredoxin [Neolewinella agarilytica]